MPTPTDVLLARFLERLVPLDPVAVWAHGSLAGGDYQEGRSDLDLVAVLPRPAGIRTARAVVTLHRALRAEPLADRLHCSYLAPDTLGDAGRAHLTWAHEHVLSRPVTPVTRRELAAFGRVLYGAAPDRLLPPVPDAELGAFVVRDQREFWRPAVDRPRLWRQDIWVDLGLTTHARAVITLREGRLVPKREALDALPGLGAPAEVVEDVRRRRYDGPGEPPTEPWTVHRAELTRSFLAPAIDALVTAYG
ncbi:nucleotidyltransferase domain-containing protein [Streptomyces mangrovisoli]|uniref:Nucleotidyltransferase n=1 Tax=Streptomyces mangrovisoli TaxID=1428628 RepID=A0A1J4NP45_9ACTN|nr:nucleotidyltransferase domain-containing protein [Streptomyces mangrovisoli]OIJ62950.1 nucleotidyltransferase [Streptomyces mangrovisoli]